MIDVREQVNAIRRTLGTRVLEAGEARVQTISQVYHTDLDDLWDVVTNAERIPRWFMPITGELKEGGHYQLEGNAGGTITSCDRPRGYAATWEFDDKVSWIEVRLDPEGRRPHPVRAGARRARRRAVLGPVRPRRDRHRLGPRACSAWPGTSATRPSRWIRRTRWLGWRATTASCSSGSAPTAGSRRTWPTAPTRRSRRHGRPVLRGIHRGRLRARQRPVAGLPLPFPENRDPGPGLQAIEQNLR